MKKNTLFLGEEVCKLTGPEDFPAPIATAGELLVIATAAVDAIGLGAELLVDQRLSTVRAEEAGFVPVLILVRQVLQKSERSVKNLSKTSELKGAENNKRFWESI